MEGELLNGCEPGNGIWHPGRERLKAVIEWAAWPELGKGCRSNWATGTVSLRQAGTRGGGGALWSNSGLGFSNDFPARTLRLLVNGGDNIYHIIR